MRSFIAKYSVIKILPNGQEVLIARKEVNLSMSFGEQFQEQIVEMEMTKQAQGINIKSLSFKAIISCQNQADREVYNQCVEWRQFQDDKTELDQ